MLMIAGMYAFPFTNYATEPVTTAAVRVYGRFHGKEMVPRIPGSARVHLMDRGDFREP